MGTVDSMALFSLNYGLYIVSSSFGGKRSGCVVNTLQQVTNTPEKLSVTVGKDSFTCSLIKQSGVFGATVLTEKTDMEVVKAFGFRSGKDGDKFARYDIGEDENGVPYLKNHMAARFSCRVESVTDVGTHLTFVGVVTEGEKLSVEPPMTYTYYHNTKNGLTPPSAPSFREDTGKKGWRCTVCGYVHEGDLPEDYICPVCGVTAEQFEEQKPGAKRWRCKVCGYIYEGDEFPEDFICPICGVPSDEFELIE
ncbi:flavin reductase [Ruminococcaceae bacterium OttesenSCG-928-L11]|nr:flavin reductase [Ruminococcaceae bacterium OttesenSCG-928-L11]